jgi:hypothetical protein
LVRKKTKKMKKKKKSGKPFFPGFFARAKKAVSEFD